MKAQVATPAEAKWGYRFGVNGTCTVEEAARRLSVTTRTVWTMINQGLIRKGNIITTTKAGARGKAVICRRSLDDHLAACET